MRYNQVSDLRSRLKMAIVLFAFISFSISFSSANARKIEVLNLEDRPEAHITQVLDTIDVVPTAVRVPRPEPGTATLSSLKVVDGAILVVSYLKKPEEDDLVLLARFGKNEAPFFAGPGGIRRALIGVPHDHEPGSFFVELEIGKERLLKLPFEVLEGKYRSEKLKVNPALVKPPKKNLKRIRRESREIGAIYRNVTYKKYWDGAFVLPVNSIVTSPYGTKRVYNGKKKGYHKGVDLRAGVGTPIFAPAAGRVVMAKSLYFTGNTVILDHGYGLITIYGHLSRLSVKKGQVVQTGKKIGLAGKTGRVNGPHLHWGAVIHRVKVNPLELTRVFE